MALSKRSRLNGDHPCVLSQKLTDHHVSVSITRLLLTSSLLRETWPMPDIESHIDTVGGDNFITVVVDDDSNIQRIVLATEETTVTQQGSHIPIKCRSRLWSQRGTKVNGSHHGDNPLLRPTGIQIATKRYAALQAMAPTNIKKVHQTSFLRIESNLDRLGLLSPTHDQRSQQKNGKLTL